jgi:uncharacterized membrane protein YuzA (DUF378 family)
MFVYKGRCGTGKVTWILVAIGAINWGLVGLGGFFGSNWNLVSLLIGSWSPIVEYIVYVLVGIAGVMFVVHKCAKCSMAMKMHADGMGQGTGGQM